MSETPAKVRLGGMALQNGVLVHGPTSWACAIRTDSGEIKVASGRKGVRGARVKTPFLRGPARLADAFILLKDIHSKLPEAQLPFARPEVLGAMLTTSIAVKRLKANENIPALARELMAGVLSIAPAVTALSGSDLASYHGAEHIAIGSYEHGVKRPKEHERCGSHLIGPMLVGQALAGVAAARAPKAARPLVGLLGSLAATGVATELFAWMGKNPEHPLSRALARPGHELQVHFGTREPSREQLRVAELALQTCLALEESSETQADAPPAL
jgi:uncharacterized protein YqhQ